MLPCALASRQHSKFVSVRLIRRLLQTNGASGSSLSSSTIRILFGVFRIIPMHMNWCKTGRDCISQGHSWKPAYPLRTFASSFDGATAMSIWGLLRLVHPHQLRHETAVCANQSSIFTPRMSYSGPLGCRWFFRWWEEGRVNWGHGL